MNIQPIVRPNELENRYELVHEYIFTYGEKMFTIPAGFTYDGASIPKICWQFVYSPFSPDVMLPALIHDWLYATGKTSKYEADNIFYTKLLANGVKKLKAKAMYQAVNWFGKGNW